MNVDSFVDCLQTTWEYFPYLLYTFVIVTFLPKTLGNIVAFADADYNANRNKYHRCYGPETCCHTLPKPKQRKTVTRVYPKRQPSSEQDAASVVKRPAATGILSANHVNEIAKMFESGATCRSRKINRVPPTVLPEVRSSRKLSIAADDHITINGNNITNNSNIDVSNSNCISKKHSAPEPEKDVENIENVASLLNQVKPSTECDVNWRSEPIVAPRQRQHHQQRRPSTLSFSDGASATPSSGSPTAWLESSPPSRVGAESPTLRRVPLNLKPSLEDIFAAIARSAETNTGCDFSYKFAGCGSLSPVTSIEDILSQRRLSRPLSAYSISDLLSSEESSQSCVGEAFVESVLRSLNQT